MIKVGLTGGVSAGKTTARLMFAELGAAVADADEMVAELYAPGGKGSKAVERLFGAEFLDRRGAVDHKKLADHVFADSSARHRLEEAIHPLVIEEIRRWFEEEEKKGAPLAVVEASQIFEGGYEAEFDRVVLVVSPEIVRMKRWRVDGLEADEVARRMAAQIVENEARRKADDVIVNAGTVEELHAKVEAVYRKYVPAA